MVVGIAGLVIIKLKQHIIVMDCFKITSCFAELKLSHVATTSKRSLGFPG